MLPRDESPSERPITMGLRQTAEVPMLVAIPLPEGGIINKEPPRRKGESMSEPNKSRTPEELLDLWKWAEQREMEEGLIRPTEESEHFRQVDRKSVV